MSLILKDHKKHSAYIGNLSLPLRSVLSINTLKVLNDDITFILARLNELYGRQFVNQVFLNVLLVIPFAIHSLHNCLKADMTFEQCKNYWGTLMLKPRKFTLTCSIVELMR